MNSIPARLYVLLARDANVGLVIRRGPARQVATILWDRNKDTFTLGQWLKGRIYERRCDLSPNGKLFLYFALKGEWNNEATGCWTAVSQAPYLKAISLYPQGATYGGGGLWLDNSQFWIHGHIGHEPLRESKQVQRVVQHTPASTPGTHYDVIHFSRLLRAGWSLVNTENNKYTFDKAVKYGWILRKYVQPRKVPPVAEQHELIHPGSNTTLDAKSWEWADYDSKRLLWATEGKLFATTPTTKGLGEIKELHDFNNMIFEPLIAPY